MSLEIAIQENTAAIRELIAAMASAPVAAKPEATTPAPKSKSKSTGPDTPKAEPAKVEETAPVTTGGTSLFDEKQPEAPATITYAEVSAAVLASVKANGHAPTVEVLARFGAANAKVVPEAQYPELLAALSALQGA